MMPLLQVQPCGEFMLVHAGRDIVLAGNRPQSFLSFGQTPVVR
jgi:hypothetical protein